MLVLDTVHLPASQRAEAFQAAISGNASASLARFDSDVPVQARLHLYDFGPGRVLNVDATGNTLHRTPAMARRDEQHAVAIAVPIAGRNLFRWGREEAVLGAGEMLLVDLDAPYQYGWHGTGSSYAFQVDRERLDIPIDTIRRAATRLQTSPLYPLVRDRLMHTTLNAQQLGDRGTAARVGETNLMLLQALITSAARPSPTSPTSGPVLTQRILRYIRHHLAEPDLTPQQIAAAHHISVRYLYQLFERQQISLEAWVISQRLEAIKAALGGPATSNHTIAAIARSFGMPNPTFFATRFKQAYGVTPRQWREQATQIRRSTNGSRPR